MPGMKIDNNPLMYGQTTSVSLPIQNISISSLLTKTISPINGFPIHAEACDVLCLINDQLNSFNSHELAYIAQFIRGHYLMQNDHDMPYDILNSGYVYGVVLDRLLYLEFSNTNLTKYFPYNPHTLQNLDRKIPTAMFSTMLKMEYGFRVNSEQKYIEIQWIISELKEWILSNSFGNHTIKKNAEHAAAKIIAYIRNTSYDTNTSLDLDVFGGSLRSLPLDAMKALPNLTELIVPCILEPVMTIEKGMFVGFNTLNLLALGLSHKFKDHAFMGLNSLETLYVGCTVDRENRTNCTSKAFASGLSQLKNLYLQIEIDDDLNEEEIDNNDNANIGNRDANIYTKIDINYLTNLEKLTLEVVSLAGVFGIAPIPQSFFSGLINLTSLSIYYNGVLEKFPCQSNKLTELVLYQVSHTFKMDDLKHCSSLNSISISNIESFFLFLSGSFNGVTNLTHLSIKSCSILRNLILHSPSYTDHEVTWEMKPFYSENLIQLFNYGGQRYPAANWNADKDLSYKDLFLKYNPGIAEIQQKCPNLKLTLDLDNDSMEMLPPTAAFQFN